MTHAISIRTIIIATLLVAGTPFMALANIDCAFGRTLDLGVSGEDVRCLQVFLNGAGMTVAASGAGSVGSETTQFGSLTEAAVLRWQKSASIPGANGVFGPASQAAYLLNRAVAVATPATTVIATATPVPAVAGVSVTAGQEGKAVAETALNRVLEIVEDAEDAVSSVDDEDDRLDLEDELRQVRRDLFGAIRDYMSGKYVTASATIKNVLLDAADIQEAAEDAEDSVSERDAAKTVANAWDAYDDADDEVSDAEDNNDRGADDARDLLKDARDLLRDADDAIDDEDWKEAADLADEALDLIDDALDEL